MLRKSKYLIVSILAILLLLTGCKDKETDALKFKNEYESLNNTKIEDKEVRSIIIDEDNPMIYKTEDDIVNYINNKESFLVYFGFAKCPWCRSVISSLIESSKENKLSTIYYVDILDIRDVYEKDEEGNFVKTKEGTSGYNKLLELLGDKLQDYKINNEKVGEKRIYAPNIVSIIDGKVDSIITGISPLQTDAYMDLTPDMIIDEKNAFDPIIKKVVESQSSCDISGC